MHKSIGWMDWDGGLTWPAPKNSSAVFTGGSTKTLSWPRRKRTYLYMLVLKGSWACGSGQESAHCWSRHCSALSCRALVRHSGTGWRAPCPVQISTSSKWPMSCGLDQVLAQAGPGNRSSRRRIVLPAQKQNHIYCISSANKPRNDRLQVEHGVSLMLSKEAFFYSKWQKCLRNDVLTESTSLYGQICGPPPPQLTPHLCWSQLFTHSESHTCSVMHTGSHGERDRHAKGLFMLPHMHSGQGNHTPAHSQKPFRRGPRSVTRQWGRNVCSSELNNLRGNFVISLNDFSTKWFRTTKQCMKPLLKIN